MLAKGKEAVSRLVAGVRKIKENVGTRKGKEE